MYAGDFSHAIGVVRIPKAVAAAAEEKNKKGAATAKDAPAATAAATAKEKAASPGAKDATSINKAPEKGGATQVAGKTKEVPRQMRRNQPPTRRPRRRGTFWEC